MLVLYLIARFVLRPAFLILRPTITGLENVPATGPFIIASNHLSFIDSMAIPLMARRKVGYLAKAEYFTGTGIKGWFTLAPRALACAFIGTDGCAGGARHRDPGAAGWVRVRIYPEGTRSRDGRRPAARRQLPGSR